MIPLDVGELRSLELGALEGAGEITGVQIDSRRIAPGDLFVAVGRGADFILEARAAGAAATLVPRDAFAALAAIAGIVRQRSHARVVAITGSTGKTSTKDILSALCEPVVRTVASEASFNNELGVPLTVCRLEPDTELVIVEMGMRGFGQIAQLCSFVRPHAGVVTAIGPAHLELVGDIAGVARAKGELLQALPEGGVAVVPADSADALAPFMRDDLVVRRTPRVDEVGLVQEQSGTTVTFGGHRIPFAFTARHQLQNALTALTAYEALGLPLDRAGAGAGAAAVSRWRGEELELPGGGVAINDAYNANPDSMRAALLHLRERSGAGRAMAVLGGMAELGEAAAAYHRAIAELTAELSIDVVAVGELGRLYGVAQWVPDAESAIERVANELRPGDSVLVKASRAVGLEGVAPALANREASWSES